MANYPCPACRLLIGRAVDGKCPHCNRKIKAVQINDTTKKTGLKTKYVLDEAPEIPRPELKDEEKPQQGWVMISQFGAMPAIYLYVDPTQGITKKYRIVWGSGMAPLGFIHCPSCSQKLINNMVIGAGSEIEQEAHCRRCKAEVTLVIGRAAFSNMKR